MPLLSLPGLFQTLPDTVPASVPYVDIDPDLVEIWGRELKKNGGFTVGIAWQGTSTYRGDHQRSIRLTHFAPLARLPGVRLISLQKGPGSGQVASLAGEFQITDFANRLDEAAGAFMDTAAIMRNLDLVICSDTSIAHLAGALGVPVWVALSHVPDWRWMLERG